MEDALRLLAGDVPLGPVCFNPGTAATMASGRAGRHPLTGADRQRAVEVESVFQRLRVLRDHCLAGGHSAADYRQAVLDVLLGGVAL